MARKIKKTLDTQHIVTQAVAAMREEAKTSTRNAATAFLKQLRKKVEAQPDLNILAPRATGANFSQAKYRTVEAYRSLVSRATKRDHTERAFDKVVWSDEAAAYYVESAVALAEKSYEDYVIKLIGKVDPEGQGVIAADLARESRNIWSQSTLHVTLADGTQQTWKTKMILNVSVYGKVFNQFPTRRVK